MAKKILGHVRLEWTCPNCQTKNPGPQKTCINCGSPQPDDVEFEQPAQEKLIKDETEIVQTKVGPDIHCFYCGTRNPGDAKTCSQCGGDLSQGTARASGRVLGAHRDRPAEKISCPACDTPNDPSASKCIQCGASLVYPRPEQSSPQPASVRPAPAKKFGLFGSIGVIVLFLLVCGGGITLFVLFNRTEDVVGTVQSGSWTRNITVEELLPVTRENWRDQIPAGAVIGTCTEKVHHTERRDTGQTREICGTAYTVDQGNGLGEVVQDCTTEKIYEDVEIYADACAYTVNEWQKVDEATLRGNDFNPQWPDVRLGTDQREGQRTEAYEIVFNTDGEIQTFATNDGNLYNQVEIGSRWILKVNTFNSVLDIEPAQ